MSLSSSISWCKISLFRKISVKIMSISVSDMKTFRIDQKLFVPSLRRERKIYAIVFSNSEVFFFFHTAQRLDSWSVFSILSWKKQVILNLLSISYFYYMILFTKLKCPFLTFINYRFADKMSDEMPYEISVKIVINLFIIYWFSFSISCSTRWSQESSYGLTGLLFSVDSVAKTTHLSRFLMRPEP